MRRFAPTQRAIDALPRDEIGAALYPLVQWHHRCHQSSLALVKSGVLPGSRVARGACTGVGGQHSWVVLGYPYDPQVVIIDPTLWSYDQTVAGIWYGSAADGRHAPFGGVGTIWTWGRPNPAKPGEAVALMPAKPFSPFAQHFLDIIGPLDREGWMLLLSHAPVSGWPAGEIIEAAENTPVLEAATPIDRVGMLTDLNPDGLYLP